MAAPGIRIVTADAGSPPLTARADVALVVGEIALRKDSPVKKADKPVYFTSFAAFARVFAWEERSVASMPDARIATTLGLAVRSFFTEGGRACHVLSVGEPAPLGTELLSGEDRAKRLARIAPDPMPRIDEPAAWAGVAHLLGLPDVSLLLAPDLPEIFARRPETIELPATPRPLEVFRPTSAPQPDYGGERQRPPVSAPRLGLEELADWATAIGRVAGLLAAERVRGGRGDVTFIAALPLSAPVGAEPACAEALKALEAANVDLRGVQLVHPWAETIASAGQPEGVEPPDGIVAGAIAATALSLGGFRSAAGRRLASLRRLHPPADRRWTDPPADRRRTDAPAANGDRWLGDSVTLLGPRQDGFELASDVVAGERGARNAGGLRRLRGILLRAARAAGEDLMFEPSLEATWTRLRRRLEALLLELFALGAFAGATPADAFNVRCDRSTMTQADIDAGRLIAVVAFVAAYPVDQIIITLDLTDGRAALGRAA